MLVTLLAAATLLSGCIFPHWGHHDNGKHKGQYKNKRGVEQHR